jgi:hypothetical protein
MRMSQPTGPELAQMLRRLFPEMNGRSFDEDVDSMSDSRCGALTAFSSQFNDWVRTGKIEPIRRALALIDQLLADSPPVPSETRPDAVGDHFHNSLLACFVENVVTRTRECRSLVVPNLGPAVRDHLQQHAPDLI